MTREERNAKLVAIGDWLATTPPGEHGREAMIEVGSSSLPSRYVEIHLSACWIPKGPAHLTSDERPLGRRYYSAHGRTLDEALSRLHAPRPSRGAR